MEHQKLLNLLNKAGDFNFVTRKWNIFNDQSNSNYDVGNEIIYKTEVLKYNLCDYNDAYILVRGGITIIGNNVTQVAFTDCAPFTKSITKVDGTTIDASENLDLVVSIYKLLIYMSNHFDTTCSLWLYSKDEATNFNVDIRNNDNFKYFKCKAKLFGDTVADVVNGILRDTTLAVPLKYLSNFWRSLEMSLIKCKVELKLKWNFFFSCSWC